MLVVCFVNQGAGRKRWIALQGKARTAAIAVAIARMSNTAVRRKARLRVLVFAKQTTGCDFSRWRVASASAAAAVQV